MKCKICDSDQNKIIYNGIIRNGGLAKYNIKNMPIYQCEECGVIWHEKKIDDLKQYYESVEYREKLEGSSEYKEFYELLDNEPLDKFRYTGTDIYRDKIVADVGCGCGAFLDFVKGVSKEVVAI